jgi:hypothetical protein
MTEQSLLPPPDDIPEQVTVAPKPPRRSLGPWLYGFGFLVLAAAIFYLWQYPNLPAEPSATASAIQAVEQHLADIDARLTRLEQRPAPDLGKITARLDSIEGRIADQGQLASRVDTLSGRIESLSARDQTGLDSTKQQIDALTSRIAASESNAGSLDSVTKRLNRIASLQVASLALAAGRPIGDLPGAPEALARYAHAAPPIEAQLRLGFPRYERSALDAKQVDQIDAPFVDRVWERAQGLITVRRGDDVVVGNPAAISLNHAQAALDAGDLADAVSAVETLKGQPAREMANWLSDAKALLGARAALIKLAEQT